MSCHLARRLLPLVCLGLSAWAGCGSQTPSSTGVTEGPPKTTNTGAADPAKVPSDAELLRQLDDVLDFTFEKRRLDVDEQAAWQIIHGALAFKRQFQVRAKGKDVSAVDYVLQGGTMKGWNLVEADVLDAKTGRRGVRAMFEPGTKAGQGHYDQWMGYLSDAGLKLDEPIIVEGKPHVVEDYLLQIEQDVPRVETKEYSWTIMALSSYRPTDYSWTASDGKTWSIPQLVEAELEYNVDDGPCGGTHRMYGLSITRNRHLARGGKLEGVWKKCDDQIRAQVARAKEAQNADGSLSSEYFRRPGTNVDVTEWMGSSGHVFEFLAEAMDKEELQQEWMKKAAWKLCEQFRKTKPVDVECAKLFHAAHGLVLYREKVFGPRTFPRSASDSKASAPAEGTAKAG